MGSINVKWKSIKESNQNVSDERISKIKRILDEKISSQESITAFAIDKDGKRINLGEVIDKDQDTFIINTNWHLSEWCHDNINDESRAILLYSMYQSEEDIDDIIGLKIEYVSNVDIMINKAEFIDTIYADSINDFPNKIIELLKEYTKSNRKVNVSAIPNSMKDVKTKEEASTVFNSNKHRYARAYKIDDDENNNPLIRLEIIDEYGGYRMPNQYIDIANYKFGFVCDIDKDGNILGIIGMVLTPEEKVKE